MGDHFLPYSRQRIEEDDIAAVVASLTGEYLTTGPTVQMFEEALASAVGAKFAVVCANGTAALHLASMALRLGPGDQVIVPTVTFLATANGPHYTGAEIVFADVDPASGLMTAESFEAALTRAPRARAVFPVHLGGACVDLEEIRQIASRRGLKVVEDACHALGGSYQDSRGASGPVGDCRFSEMAIFSFHPVKAIAMGEGGAITTNHEELYRRLLLLRSHGMRRGGEAMRNASLAYDGSGKPNPWYYEMEEPGYNYRIPDPLCALGLSQLRKLERFVAARRELAELYDEKLRELSPLVRPVFRPAHCQSGFHLYAVLIDFEWASVTRAELMQLLRDEGIGTQVHYIPVHLQPYYRSLGGNEDLPNALSYYERVLSLPLFPGMTPEDVDHVAGTLSRLLKRNSTNS